MSLSHSTFHSIISSLFTHFPSTNVCFRIPLSLSTFSFNFLCFLNTNSYFSPLSRSNFLLLSHSLFSPFIPLFSHSNCLYFLSPVLTLIFLSNLLQLLSIFWYHALHILSSLFPSSSVLEFIVPPLIFVTLIFLYFLSPPFTHSILSFLLRSLFFVTLLSHFNS